jgi:outer membrane protein OmpA-like peptidoglycan-associated protein
MRLGSSSFNTIEHGAAKGGKDGRQGVAAPRTRPLTGCFVRGLLAGLGAWLLATPASAQSDAAPNVVVNHDILNNLDWAAAVAAQARTQGTAGGSASEDGAEGTDEGSAGPRQTALLPPPEAPPQSRTLVAPERRSASLETYVAPSEGPVETSEGSAGAGPEPAAGSRPETAGPSQEDYDPASSLPGASEPSVDREPPEALAEAPPSVPPPPEPPMEPAVEPAPGDATPAETKTPAQVLPDLVEASPESAPEVPPPPPPAEETPSLAESEAAPEPPESEASPAATQTAFLLPPKLQAGEFRLLFDAGSVELSGVAKGKLAALADQLRAYSQRRVEVQAFAAVGDGNKRESRRLSLSRAQAVRAYLVEQGVPVRRIDVRALGSKSKKGPPDRVDVLDAGS